MIALNNYKEYLNILTAQTRKYGRDSLCCADDIPALVLGFSSPDDTYIIGINMVKKHFQGEWRVNSDLIKRYHQFGGKTELTAMTRLPPQATLVSLIFEATKAAIVEGERLRKLDRLD